MVSEASRKKLIVVAAVMFWLTTALNMVQLVVEGSSTINWVTTIVFLILAAYYTYMAFMNYSADDH